MSNPQAAKHTLNPHNRALPFQTPNTMFNLSNIPSTSSVLSTYTTFTAAAMLARSVVSEAQNLTHQIIPQKLQEKLLSKVGKLIGDGRMTLVIDEYNGLTLNQVFEASETFLKTKISPTTTRLKVSKSPREKDFSITINKEEKINDTFEGIKLDWQMIITETQKTSTDYEGYFSSEKVEKRSIELTFHKKYKEKVVSAYLPYVLETFKAIKEENKVVKLYSLGNFYGEYEGGPWSSVNLDHPSTFDTLAMDPTVKKELMDDLDRFVRRRKFYKRVGKAWKRGYLLYGPPGTGKSSLIAAMANYLKFHIYDLELTSLQCNSELKRILVSTSNRSILVIEDIDCSLEFENREVGGGGYNRDSQITLSGLLNFIDGLWSSCGDERIIIFTTNHKERLDPALLRPGRMDMHIQMSYCTTHGFKILASNYLGLDHHPMFGEIEQLITEVQVTPAEIAEELMKSEEVEVALQGLIKFLQMKKMENGMASSEGKSELNEEGECPEEKVEDESKTRKDKRKAKRGCRRSRRFKNI